MTGVQTLEASTAVRRRFYAAALLGLRALDARESTPRRFGADAEARWTQFAGALGPGDRIDVLLRDAAGIWGAAFSPAECFGLFGLSDDEPFGPDWAGIDDASARRLLSESVPPASLENIAEELGVATTSVVVAPVTPSTKLIVAGAGAVLSVARMFAQNRALSWTDQVAVVSDVPSTRQLAGLAAVLLGARGRTTVVRSGDGAESALRTLGFGHVDAAVVSADAEGSAAELARKLGGT
ncbi:MAG: hypothetical protein ACK6CU_18905 [Deltaproteobacteria bacterium]|jgi:hypothetical protein